MNKINNYEDLILQRKKLEADLIQYRGIINHEVAALKHKFEPVSNIISFFTPSKNNNPNNKILEVGTNLGIELLVRQKLLAKAGWFTKLVLPYVLKKVSTRAIEKVQEIRK